MIRYEYWINLLANDININSDASNESKESEDGHN